MQKAVHVLFYDRDASTWFKFSGLKQILKTDSLHEVPSVLTDIETHVARGLTAAGFLCYEAAPAFDRALQVRASEGSLPLVWFALFETMRPLNRLPEPDLPFTISSWQASINKHQYDAGIQAIKNLIAAGDTYQVNYTYRLTADFTGNAFSFFSRTMHRQPSAYAAFIETSDFALCSFSPELFFDLRGEFIQCRPMKGTAKRGFSVQEDLKQKEDLISSEKNLAENVMIVDMIRNDLGQIADPGSVHVPALFSIEKHPTLWQMTSTVQARTSASIPDLFKALFPCASITGAPKPRTMQLIHALESTPRQIYTGCIGYWQPGRQAKFNVAIRTVSIHKPTARAMYGVGGGIVWDSGAEDEYQETRTKADILCRQQTEFCLLETLLWTPDKGWFLYDAHQQRMRQSADYFDFPFDQGNFHQTLSQAVQNQTSGPQKIRLLLNREGCFACQRAGISNSADSRPVRLRLSPRPMNTQTPFVFHKTTIRQHYDRPQTWQNADDILFWNEKGELTETSIYNIVIEIKGRKITPAASCGLLAGTFRQHLLDAGTIEEAVIHKRDVQNSTQLYVINSVRKWQKAVLIS